MLPLFILYLSTSLVTANTTTDIHKTTINIEEHQKQVLCDLGCKCPEEGQSLIFLDCGGKGISSLPSSIFLDPTFKRVTFHSNHLETLKMNTFSRADEVQELDLALNIIKSIDNHTFVPFSSLTHLTMSYNRLSDLGPGLLDGLFHLRVLEMSHNIIHKLSYLAFQDTQKLQELRLQYNPIFNLPENLFRYLPNLEKLDLQDTGLVTLPYNIFRPTPRLHWLSLATNAFENVPVDALAQAPQLGVLNLSENDFTIFAEGEFTKLHNISVLYLNNLDKLSRIEKNALAGLRKLKTLTCSYNAKLMYIDQDVFGNSSCSTSTKKTPPRDQLYLRQNALRTLKSPLEPQYWSLISFVDLAENPWRCDCNLLWMAALTRETQNSIRCDSPPHLRGRTFDTISASELRCNGNWTIATFALVIASMVGFGAIMLAATTVVCSRTRVGLYVRAKKQFSYAKVTPKTETVDLEWDPSADM